MGPGGLEPPYQRGPVNTVQHRDLRQGEQDGDTAGAAESDAVDAPDDDLRRITDAWPDLLPAIRRAILAMVEASASGEE